MANRLAQVLIAALVIGCGAAMAKERELTGQASVIVTAIPDSNVIDAGEGIGFLVSLSNRGTEPITYQSIRRPNRGFYRFEYRKKGESLLWQVFPSDAALMAAAGGTMENSLESGGEVSRRDFASGHYDAAASPPRPRNWPRGTIQADLRKVGLEFVIPGEYEFVVTVKLRDGSGSIYEVRSKEVPFTIRPISREEADLVVEISKFRTDLFQTGSFRRFFDREFVCLLEGKKVPMYGRLQQLRLARLYMIVATTDRDAREALRFYKDTVATFGPSIREVLGDVVDEQFNRLRTDPTYDHLREAYWTYRGEPKPLFPLRCDQ